jgi:hypothetical protein
MFIGALSWGSPTGRPNLSRFRVVDHALEIDDDRRFVSHDPGIVA